MTDHDRIDPEDTSRIVASQLALYPSDANELRHLADWLWPGKGWALIGEMPPVSEVQADLRRMADWIDATFNRQP